MQVAFYKGTRSGLSGLFNRLVRWWTRGPYSHCEVVFTDEPSKDGGVLCGSSSKLDGGVRLKFVVLDPEVTRGLPPKLTAATGADALTHCIESFTCPDFHPMCDGIALEGVEGSVSGTEIYNSAEAAIFSMDARGLAIQNNTIRGAAGAISGIRLTTASDAGTAQTLT